MSRFNYTGTTFSTPTFPSNEFVTETAEYTYDFKINDKKITLEIGASVCGIKHSDGKKIEIIKSASYYEGDLLPEITTFQLHSLSTDAFKFLRLYKHDALSGQTSTPFHEVPCPPMDVQLDTLTEFLCRVYFQAN